MSSFNEEIKVPTDEEKCKVYKEILQKAINSGTIINGKELLKRMSSEKIRILSEDEITAILILATEMSKYAILRSAYFNSMIPERERLVEFLCNNNNFDDQNVILFINAVTNDMRECRKYTLTSGKWEFHIKRIFQFLDGKNPYKIYEEMESKAKMSNADSKEGLKLIIGGKYDG